MDQINRREALKRAAVIMGAVISAPVASGVLQGCSARPELKWEPRFFTEEQGMMVSRIADIILPKTDTPSASELGVPGFIEEMIFEVNGSTSETFVSGLKELDDRSIKEKGGSFLDLEEDEQTDFVVGLNATLPEMMKSGRPFFCQLKELTIIGYFTTEIAMTRF